MKEIFIYHENPAGMYSFMQAGDAWAVDSEKQIYAVADSPLRYQNAKNLPYPHHDYGYEAASMFADLWVDLISERLGSGDMSTDIIREILIEINAHIRELNLALGMTYDDPMTYNYAETVGFGSVVFDDRLYYGGVEDCYVNVLRGEGYEDVAKIDYQIMKAEKYMRELSDDGRLGEHMPKGMEKKYDEKYYWEWTWCNYLRNNPEARDDEGNNVGWGCFTGEPDLDSFIQVHDMELKRGDEILVFSDGMIPVLSNDEFLAWLMKEGEPTFEFQMKMRERISELLDDKTRDKEKTLVWKTYEG